MLVGLGALVPLNLELLQRLDQMIRRHDRVRAGAGMRDVNRVALHAQPEPDHADLGAHHLAVGRLGDEAGIGAVAALQGRERTDAGALLLDHRLEMNPAVGAKPAALIASSA